MNTHYDFGCVFYYQFGNQRRTKCVFFARWRTDPDEMTDYEQWETQTLGMDGLS